MAGIFKKLAKAVDEGSDRIALDSVNEKLMKNFNDGLANIRKDHNVESEIEALLSRTNEEYDRRAKKEVNRSVPDDWDKDNKDIVAVRKRMLNRTMKAAISNTLDQIGIQIALDTLLEDLSALQQWFVADATETFPITRQELEVRIASHKLQLLEQARAKLPEIDSDPLRKMVDASGRTWTNFYDIQVEEAADALRRDNDAKIQAAITALSTETTTKVRQALEAALAAADADFAAKLAAMAYLSQTEREVLQVEYTSVTGRYRAEA